MGVIDRLVYEIGYETDTASLTRAQKGIQTLQTTAKAVAAAAVTAGASILGITKKYSHMADEAIKTADRLGITVETLQGLQHAADLAGTNQGMLTNSFERMEFRVSKAATGTGLAKKALEELGFSAVALNRLKPDQQFLMIAEAIGKIKNPSDQIRFTRDIFGREAVSMVNLFNGGIDNLKKSMAEVASLGFIFNEAQARQAEEFNDNLTRAIKAVKGIGIVIGAALLPGLNDVIVGFKEWVVENKKALSTNITGFFTGLSTAIRTVWQAFRFLTRIIQPVIDQFGGLGNVVRFIIAMFLTRALLTIVVAVRAITLSVGLLAAGVGRLLGGLVLAGITLILEDIYTWIQGGDSVTGQWLGTWNEFRPKLEAVGAAFRAVFDYLVASVSITIEWVIKLGIAIGESLVKGFKILASIITLPFKLAKDGFDALFGWIGKAPALFRGMVSEIMSFLPEWLVGQAFDVNVNASAPNSENKRQDVTAKPGVEKITRNLAQVVALPTNVISLKERVANNLSTVNKTSRVNTNNTNAVTQNIKIDVSGANDSVAVSAEIERALRSREKDALRELQGVAR